MSKKFNKDIRYKYIKLLFICILSIGIIYISIIDDNKAVRKDKHIYVVIENDYEPGYYDELHPVWSWDNSTWSSVGAITGGKLFVDTLKRYNATGTIVVMPMIIWNSTTAAGNYANDIKKILLDAYKDDFEIGLHIHPSDSYIVNQTGIFDGIDLISHYNYSEQYKMIYTGKRFIYNELGIVPYTFVAGKSADSKETWDIINKLGFKIIRTGQKSLYPIYYSNYFTYGDGELFVVFLYSTTSYGRTSPLEASIDPDKKDFGSTLEALKHHFDVEYYSDRSNPEVVVYYTHSNRFVYANGTYTSAYYDLDNLLKYVTSYNSTYIHITSLQKAYSELKNQ